MTKHVSQKHYFSAIGLAMGSSIAIAIAGAAGKQLTGLGNIPFVIFLRFVAPFLFLVFYYFVTNRKIQLANMRFNFLRAIFTVSSQYCFFTVLMYQNIFIAILMMSTYGLFTPFLARIFLKRPLRFKTVLSIVITFAGVVVSLLPINDLFSYMTLIGFSSGLLIALSQITLYKTTKHSDPFSINFFMYGLSALYALILLPIISDSSQISLAFSDMNLMLLLGLVILSFASLGNQILRATAYNKINNPATLAPFLYTSIIFSAALDYFVFGVDPKWNTYIGIIIVLIGSGIMLFRKNLK